MTTKNTTVQNSGAADALFQQLIGGSQQNFGDIGGDAGVFNDLINSIAQGLTDSGNDSVALANQQRQAMDQLKNQAQKVTQKNIEDSIKVGMSNLLAKSYNMLTQSNLSLAKEAIEVAKSSV